MICVHICCRPCSSEVEHQVLSWSLLYRMLYTYIWVTMCIYTHACNRARSTYTDEKYFCEKVLCRPFNPLIFISMSILLAIDNIKYYFDQAIWEALLCCYVKMTNISTNVVQKSLINSFYELKLRNISFTSVDSR